MTREELRRIYKHDSKGDYLCIEWLEDKVIELDKRAKAFEAEMDKELIETGYLNDIIDKKNERIKELEENILLRDIRDSEIKKVLEMM